MGTAIHNKTLPKGEELIYLKRCVYGHAEKLIKNLVTTSDNYEMAWGNALGMII